MFINSQAQPQIHKKAISTDVSFKFAEVDKFVFDPRNRVLIVDYNFGDEREIAEVNGSPLSRLVVLHSQQFSLTGAEFEQFYNQPNTQQAMGQVMALIINTCIQKGFLQGAPQIGLDWDVIPTKTEGV